MHCVITSNKVLPLLFATKEHRHSVHDELRMCRGRCGWRIGSACIPGTTLHKEAAINLGRALIYRLKYKLTQQKG